MVVEELVGIMAVHAENPDSRSKKVIVLVYPNFIATSTLLQSAFSKIIQPSHFPHIGLGYIAAVLEQNHHVVKIIDATVENLEYSRLVNKIKHIQPDIIGITTNVMTAMAGIQSSIKIKQAMPDTNVFFGGPWATINWHYLLRSGYADVVVIGEGEETILDLMQGYSNDDALSRVKGIAYKNAAGILVKNESKPRITNLDALPFPAWHLFPPIEKYNFINKKRKAYPVLTSRGCPYGCYFCSKFVHGAQFRARTSQSILAELVHLKTRYQAEEIMIIDDNFTLDMKRAREIVDKIIEAKLGLTFTFSNGVRADTMKKEFVQRLKRAGTLEIAIAVESGNQDVLDKTGKKLDLHDVVVAARNIKDAGIILRAFFIIGLLHDTPTTIMQTIHFAQRIDPDILQVSKATPWIGTRMYDIIKKEGIFTGSPKKIQSFNLFHSQFKIWNLTPQMVDRGFMLAYVLFYFRLRKVIRFFKSITTLNQLKWALSVALQVGSSFL